jgi:hypothetical protein
MNPWFPEQYAWIFGTAIGMGGGIFGMLLGTFGPAGKAKGLVFGYYWVLLLTSAAMLVACAVAWLTGQPYGVWYGLGLAGLIGTLVLGLNYKTVTNVYRRAEERKLAAQNL